MPKAKLSWREMLPIVARELRVAAKRRVSYRLRMIVACLGALALILASFIPGKPAEVGKAMFWTMSCLMLVVCGGAGLLLTVDSISREKREGTLGLLFLTRLGGADIVLGKLAAGALSGGSVCFAALPFLAFSLCVGGVTGRDFLAMSLLLLFLIAFSLTLGIFLSALFRREATVSLLFCLLMILPAACAPLAIVKWKATPAWLANVNPYYAAMAKMDDGGLLFPREHVWSSLGLQTLAMFLMVGAASLIVPWTVRTAPVSRRLDDVEPVALKKVHLASRRALLDINPVLWLSQRQNHPVLLVFLVAGVWAAVGFSGATPFESEIAYVALLALLPKVFVLWQSTGMMAAERQSGFLEALLTTPITAGEILQGKMGAIKRQVAPALLFGMIVQWAILNAWFAPQHEIDANITLVLASMATLLIDVHTIAWIGLWQGLTARDRRRALAMALLWGVIGPWLPGLLGLGAILVVFDPGWVSEPEYFLSLAFISANVFSISIACFAMVRLHEKFRSSATQTWAARGAH